MKIKSTKLPLVTSSVIALIVSSTACWAAATLKLNNFDTAAQLSDWGPNATTLTWDGTQDAGGSSTVGSMKVQFAAGSNPWGTQPQRNLGAQAFHSSQYWSVSFDFKIDPTSSLGSDPNAPYGHVQVIPIDNNGTWLSGFGWTAITEQFTNWQHLEMALPMPYTNLNALVVQVGDAGFTSDVIFYIDNLQVNPVPTSLIVDQFTNDTSVAGWNWQNWSAPGTSEWVSSPDAGGGAAPGSLKLTCNFANKPTEYQQCVFQKNFSADPNRFTYLDMDVKLDPSSYPMFNGNTYGTFEVILAVDGNWRWATLGTLDLRANHMTNWTHISYPVGGKNATNMQAFILKLGGGWSQDGLTNTVIVNVDNIRLWTPEVSPTLSLKKSGPAGMEFISTAPTDDWQRQGIVTPDYTRDYSWYNRGQPVTYSFTLADFPAAANNPGFEAHLYLVNVDTLASTWDETYSGVDWNARDLINVKLQNNAGAGGVDFSFNYKTNLGGANVNQTVAVIHSPTAIGTFAVTFNDNTSVTLTTPGGATTNFTIPQQLADSFASQVTLHFGTFKNRIVNNYAKATFSRIQVTGVSNPIDERFPGPGLNPDPANPFWRLAADPAGLRWVPPGTAYWLDWTLPDSGFTVQSAPTITGPWGDPGLGVINSGPTSKSAAIPAASLPAASSAFFRMIKTGQ